MLQQEVVVPKGFFASLFDLSFTSFVTTRVIKALYALSLVVLAAVYLIVAIGLFKHGGDSATLARDGSLQTESGGNTVLGILWLMFGPILLFVYALVFRVLSELVTVFFRIFENTHDQLALTRAALFDAGEPVTGTETIEKRSAPGDTRSF
ncbi:MAG TPA: DUF4282 domain-containing protein [Conexibacter sp.]|jgi:hypothetical protein